MSSHKVLITGASGFVGSRVCEFARARGFIVLRALRSADERPGDAVIGNIGPETNWSTALERVKTVVHLAARVHVMTESAKDPLVEFSRINVEGTVNLARQAAQAGVRRLVFISSVKVNGEATMPGEPFGIMSSPDPQDPYAISKLEAEKSLRRVEKETGLEVVIIRPPLVYGPGVKANFLRILKAVQKGFPLPFGLVNNQRSLVFIDNLVDLILICMDHPAAAGQTFLVSDREDLSTPELIQKLARTMGKECRLFPVPPAILRLGGRMMGKKREMDRLLNSLQVDIRHTFETLGWNPPISVDEGLQETAQWYMHGN